METNTNTPHPPKQPNPSGTSASALASYRPGLKLPLHQIEPVQSFLKGFSSENTHDAYLKDLHDFFEISKGADIFCDAVQDFVRAEEKEAQRRMETYRRRLQERESERSPHRPLHPKTVNRRLATMRSLLLFSHETFGTPSSGRRLVRGLRMSGQSAPDALSPDELERFLAQPALSFPKNRIRRARDTAILCLFCENGLRRAEVAALNVGDFLEGDFRGRMLLVRHTARAKTHDTPDAEEDVQDDRAEDLQGGPPPSVERLSHRCAAALEEYLKVARHGKDPQGPLLRNLDRRQARQSAGIRGGNRLSVDGLYALVQEYGGRLKMENISPDRLRQSAPKQPRRMPSKDGQAD